METIVHFLDWTFAVDKQLTESIYANVLKGGAEECGCSMCRNYIQYRRNIYPIEIEQLFQNLGIDINKDFEIYHNTRLAQNLHSYGGWYNFAGKILKENESKIAVINPYFSIGFVQIDKPSVTFFENIKLPIVQVEIYFDIPWVISEVEPD
ncbi:MAG TPA: hypothetical protein VEC36_03500 [Patescibacteria group bacterium]|nr:hypothetical protein [Patescibacteria group bacterium]